MTPKLLGRLMLTALTLLAAQACDESKDNGGSQIDGHAGNGSAGKGSAGDGSVVNGTAGSLVLGLGGLGISMGGSGDDPTPAPGTLPDGFSKADVGGYLLGDPITDATGAGGEPSTNGEGCGTVILAVIRDFKSDHPDFEKALGAELGLVQPELGADRKPVFAHDAATATVSGPESFDQWYRNVDGVNQPFVLQMFFAPKDGTTSFQSNAFFPLDDEGFGDEGNDHNFHFTTEIHTQFRYNGGEVFNFTGDDDVWIYINGKLLVDLGGVHAAEPATVDVDMRAAEVGITKGQVYPFDMFQAERHTSASNFRADTNLEFVDCGTIVPDVPK